MARTATTHQPLDDDRGGVRAEGTRTRRQPTAPARLVSPVDGRADQPGGDPADAVLTEMGETTRGAEDSGASAEGRLHGDENRGFSLRRGDLARQRTCHALTPGFMD